MKKVVIGLTLLTLVFTVLTIFQRKDPDWRKEPDVVDTDNNEDKNNNDEKPKDTSDDVIC